MFRLFHCLNQYPLEQDQILLSLIALNQQQTHRKKHALHDSQIELTVSSVYMLEFLHLPREVFFYSI